MGLLQSIVLHGHTVGIDVGGQDLVDLVISKDNPFDVGKTGKGSRTADEAISLNGDGSVIIILSVKLLARRAGDYRFSPGVEANSTALKVLGLL